MNTRNIFAKVSIALALVALLASGVVWEVRRVRAAIDINLRAAFGMVGITRGQTMRLNIVNLVNASGGQLPPDPCRATMEVFDNATGRTSLFSAGFVSPPDPDHQQ